MAGVAQVERVPAIPRGGDEAAIVPQTPAQRNEDARWKRVGDLGCDMTVDLPVPHFKIADLLKLQKGLVIDAHWKVGRDVPLNLNFTQIGWVEFDVVSDKLAVRLTELA